MSHGVKFIVFNETRPSCAEQVRMQFQQGAQEAGSVSRCHRIFFNETRPSCAEQLRMQFQQESTGGREVSHGVKFIVFDETHPQNSCAEQLRMQFQQGGTLHHASPRLAHYVGLLVTYTLFVDRQYSFID